MAKYNGIFQKMKGSIGNLTFRYTGGQTVVSEKVAPKANPSRSLAQMKLRVQWQNIIANYAAFNGLLHPSFEKKARNVSDYNEFMSANAGLVQVYLDKDTARAGGGIVAPYQITRGSLPSIVVYTGTDNVTPESCSIKLGSAFTITAATTVKDFSDVVIAANEDFQDGDEITFFYAAQLIETETSMPRISVFSEQVTLDRSDSATLLRGVVSAKGFSVVNGNLGCNIPSFNGGIAWVHSRRTASGVKVSTQRLKVKNTLLAEYQAVTARDKAIESYGGVLQDEWLTPDNPDIIVPQPTPPGPAPSTTAVLTLRATNPDSATFTVNGEEYDGPVTVNIGESVSVHAEPAEGYTIVKWQDTGNDDPDREVTVSTDTTLILNTEEA